MAKNESNSIAEKINFGNKNKKNKKKKKKGSVVKSISSILGIKSNKE